MKETDKKLNLLLIEDNPGDVRILREVLRDLPEIKLYNVICLSDAIEYLSKNKTDLVLLDLGLPDSQGLDTVRKISSQIPMVPVIVLTGLNDDTLALQAIKVGAQDYLIKGKIDPELLQRSIHYSIERKLADETLRLSEKRYRTFIDSTSDYVFLKDDQFKHLVANLAYCKSYNKTEKDILGCTDFDLMPEDFASTCEITDKQVIAINGMVISEERWDDKTFEACKFPVEYQKGKIGVGGFVRDITERKRAEKALIFAHNELENLHNNLGEAIFSIDTVKNEMTQVSFAHEDIFGYPVKDFFMNSQLWYECILEEDKPIFDAGFPFLMSGQKVQHEIRIVRADGQIRWIEAKLSPTLDDNGKLAHIDGFASDITERKQVQEEIKMLNAELEERVSDRTIELQATIKEMETFSYSVSHDLRAPLRAIDGFTRILVEDYEQKLDAEGKRLCSMIRDNTHRMGQLIDDLLTFSRLSRVSLNISKFEMNTLIRSVYNEITLPETRQRIDFQLGKIASVPADGILLRQVWINLISNAIKFSSSRETAVIRISCKQYKNMVVYEIKDNGVGFDMKYIDKLFGVFQRLHSVKDFEGTGVGLAIVQHIIIRHGGKAWAEGEVNNGATFYFSLPV